MNRQIQKQLRHNQYLSDKHNFDVKACVIAGVLPTILEYFEDLKEVFPEHYTKDVIFAINNHLNAIYFKCPEDEKSAVATQQMAITSSFENWIETNFKND
jgi:hypothetical protein